MSATFHGRDVFGPVAAHLSLGVHLADLGPPVDDWWQLEIPVPTVSEFEVIGEIIAIDRFGNLTTNIDEATLRGWLRHQPLSGVHITMGGCTVTGICDSYSEVAPDEPLGIIGSAGFLEVAVRNGSAAQFFTAFCGHQVALRSGRA